ncbi:MAG: DUF4162 domain-containing protein, partial [Blastocatellia bacterium]
VRSVDGRAARELLTGKEGVLSVEPAGAALHLFLDESKASPESLYSILNEKALGPASFRKIAPSLEDVFIALIRKAA